MVDGIGQSGYPTHGEGYGAGGSVSEVPYGYDGVIILEFKSNP